MKINQISPQDSEYTSPLENIAKPPKSLYFIGNLPSERRPTIAIVGTRKPTAYGREVTTRFARDLAARGVVVVSGLALGVDAIGHAAALDAGGTTLAFLANALPRIQPATNRALGERIVQHGGALISEHDNDENFGRWSFLERNRLVAGIADAILITEAGAQSGTLNTASHALAEGKDVFVVPGNITSPQSMGCNLLIKQGATPVTSVDDILQVLIPGSTQQQASLALGSTQLETDLLMLIEQGVRDGDELQQRLDIDPVEFMSTLTMLELNGMIRSLGANQWTRR